MLLECTADVHREAAQNDPLTQLNPTVPVNGTTGVGNTG